MRCFICISTFLLWDMGFKVIERPGKETILGHSVWLQLRLRPAMATSLRELYTRSLLGLKLVLLKVTLAWSVSWRSGCCSKCLGWLAFRLGLGCGCELWFCLWLWYPQSFFLIWVEFICVLKERKIIVKKRKSMFGIILYWFSMFLVIIYFYK